MVNSLSTSDDTDIEDEGKLNIEKHWAVELMNNYVQDVLGNSPKMEICFAIIKESVALQDKILIFSQSLATIDTIEKFLNIQNYTTWMKNWNYFRMLSNWRCLQKISKCYFHF